MASTWIEKRPTAGGAVRHRVRYRLGGRESKPHYGGTFKTKREARARCAWIDGELAAMRVPDLAALAEPASAPTLREAAARWRTSRVDIRDNTRIQHGTALGRLLPTLGDRRIDTLTPADVADMIGQLREKGKKRETIRKTVTALAMILDHAGVSPNPARDRIHVRLPREEPSDMEPPTADHIEAVGWLLKPDYLLALLVLDATGVRLGELQAARVGDLDEQRKAWLVRGAVSKTRKPRWVELPDDLFATVVERLPAREDRDPAGPLLPGVTADRLRTAIGRACRDAGVPAFSPHDLRHRRISLLHRAGESWAEIGKRVGQRNLSVTADTYTHALLDYEEVDRAKLLARVQDVLTPVLPLREENAAFAATS